jgi:hypothetical protein
VPRVTPRLRGPDDDERRGTGEPPHQGGRLVPLPGPTDDSDSSRLAAQILRLLEERGVPSGAWLVDIAEVRASLREADALLRRLEQAIEAAARRDVLDP